MERAFHQRRTVIAGAVASTAMALLTRCGGGGGNSTNDPSTADSWAEDLPAMASNIRSSHPDPKGITLSAAWNSAVGRIATDASGKSAKENVLAAIRLAALMQDEHTAVSTTPLAFAEAPIRFATASDGPWVQQISASHINGLGARLIAIDGTSVTDVTTRLRTYISAATAEGYAFKTPPMLHQCELLALIGVGRSATQATYTLRSSNGVEFDITLQGNDTSALQSIYGRTGGPVAPLWLSQLDRNYFMTPLSVSQSIYLRYARCAVDAVVPIDTFIDSVAHALSSLPEPRLIVDLRNNPGGDSSIFSNALLRLFNAFPRLLQTRAIVLINNGVFSSATINLYDLLRLPNVTTIGEPPGTAPNHTGEVRNFALARTGLVHTSSTKVFTLDSSLGSRNYTPNIFVAPSVDDRANGRDPVLARAETLLTN